MTKSSIKWVQSFILAISLSISFSGWSETVNESVTPSFGVMVADTLLIRPLTFAGMLIGSVVFVVSLPITAITGTVGEAGKTLVADPALSTFARCLGCTAVGWRKLPTE